MYNKESPYHRRRAHLLQKSREARGNKQANQYISVDRFLNVFETIYNEYYQTKVTIHYRKGWYYLGQHHLHKSDLVKMMERMLVELHLEQVPTVEQEENNDVPCVAEGGVLEQH